MKELIFYDNLSPKDYLKQCLCFYPYDIEECMVYSLLNKTTYPHPVLLNFIAYFANIAKFHILHKQIKQLDNLHPLYVKMCTLSQANPSLLHLHQYQFDATIYVSHQTFSHPYAHLPFSNISFLDDIQLHTIPILSMEQNSERTNIIQSKSFIYKDISIDANDFIGICICIADKKGIIFLSKACLSMAIGLAALYQIEAPCTHYDFILLFGLALEKNKKEYYFDETNQLTIGLVSGSHEMYNFLYLKDMILTLYNSICLKKDDLPIHASMLQLHYKKVNHGLVFAGESGTGKSELLDAFQSLCKQRDIAYTLHFDDHGTFHYLDNEIVCTGTELAACKNIVFTKQDTLFHNFSASIFLQEDTHVNYQVIPLTTYQASCQFKPVSMLFYLDNVTKKKGFRQIENLEEAIQIFSKGMYRNQQQQIRETFFFNPLGCAQQQDVCTRLLRDFFTILYVQSIPIFVLYTYGTSYQKTHLYDKLAHQILNELIL